MKSKDQQLLEEAYNKIQSKQLQEDAGDALRSYSNAGDNTVLTQIGDMFTTALELVGKAFGGSSSGNSQGAGLSLEQAKDVRNKISQAIEGKYISFYSGGMYHDAKPHLTTLLAKLDANIKQAEEAAKAYSQSGFFGRLFKSSGKNVARANVTDSEYGALMATEKK